MKYPLLWVLAFLLLSGIPSCSKSKGSTGGNTADTTCSDFTPGQLEVAVTPTSTIEEVFAHFDSLRLPISQIAYFAFFSPYPADSIPTLDSLLSHKPYFSQTNWNWAVKADSVGSVTIDPVFELMDSASQADWIQTEKTLHLTAALPDSPNGLLLVQVPNGMEKVWLQRLRGNALVYRVQLECWVTF
jgi:hypothetical protein